MKEKVYVICGPTASGKSSLANDLADKTKGVIVNADAFQVYKEIPICTASPGIHDKAFIKHELYNHISIKDDYSVGHYISEARKAIECAFCSGKTPILVGGTGLYIQSLLYGIDEIPKVPQDIKERACSLFENLGIDLFYQELLKMTPDAQYKINPKDKQRMMRAYEVYAHSGKPVWSFYGKSNGISANYDIEIIKIMPSERNELYSKCDARVLHLIKQGAIEEVKGLIDIWHEMKPSPKKAILVNELHLYLSGALGIEDAISLAQKNTRNYAKRQYTWFRKMPGKVMNDLV